MRQWLGRAWWHCCAAAVALLLSVPLVVMVSGSLRRPGAPPARTPELIPADASLASYGRALDLVDLGQQLRNSAIVSIAATVLAVVSASFAGLVIARSSRRVAWVLVALAVIGMVVPPTALLVGRFALFRTLGVLDTFVPLIVPALYGVSSLGVLIYAWSFGRIPSSVFETAAIEGLSPFAMWRRIAMPLARPMTVAVAALAFVTTWNDFLSPLAYLTSSDLYTVPMGLRALQLVGRQDVPVLLAACVIATAPVLVAFALAQRHLFPTHERVT